MAAMTVFLIVGAVGAGVLVLSLLFDGLLDGFHALEGFNADGIFSITAIGAGLTLFGACGLATVSLGGGWWLAMAIAAVVGALGWWGVVAIIRKLRASTLPDRLTAVGDRGQALTPVGSIGEVLLDGDVNKRLARSEGPQIPVGTPIRVVDTDGTYLVVISDETPVADATAWPQLPQGE